MKNLIHKKYFVFSLFLVFIFSGCSTSTSEQTTEKTSPLTVNMSFPDFNKAGEAKGLRAVTVDPETVATLNLSVIDNKGKVLTQTTISVTPGALVTHSLDIPLDLSLIIDATLSDASGNLLFSGRSAAHTFAKGLSASLNLTMKIVNPLLGSWLLIEDEGVSVAAGSATSVLTFTSDTEYFMVDETAPFVDCFVGMEHGTYTWDNTTNDFAITSNIVDTTGGCGLHDSGVGVGVETFGLTIDKDILSLFEPGTGALTAKFAKVKSESNALIGSWLGIGDNSTTIVTFINGTDYFIVDNHLADPVSCDGTSPVNAGMEHGTYTHNAATNAFSVTGNKFDTNGGCGLNEPPIDPFSNAALSTHHNILELTSNEGGVFLLLNLPIQASPAPVIIESAKPVFEAATLPGNYYTVWSDFPRNIEQDTFNADGTGLADFVGSPSESFTWEIDSQGRLLLIEANSSPTALPDRFTLVSGTINEGVFNAELDDNEDGEYETFPTVTFLKSALTKNGAQDIQNKIIAIDGNNADWGNIQPVFLDPSGDQNGNTSTDLTKIAIAKSEGSIALLMEVSGNIAMPHTPNQDFSHYEIGFHFFDNSSCTGNDNGFFIVNNFTSSVGENFHTIDGNFGDGTLTNPAAQITTTAFSGNALETSFNANLLPTNKGQFFSLNPYVQSFSGGLSTQHDQADADICFRLPL